MIAFTGAGHFFLRWGGGGMNIECALLTHLSLFVLLVLAYLVVHSFHMFFVCLFVCIAIFIIFSSLLFICLLAICIFFFIQFFFKTSTFLFSSHYDTHPTFSSLHFDLMTPSS